MTAARKPIRRSRKPLPARSERVLRMLGDRARVVDAAFDRDRGECRARHLVVDVRCDGPLDPHEVIPRSAWHDGQYDLDNIVMVCRAHHRWIDNHPALAHAVGLHKFSWERTGRQR